MTESNQNEPQWLLSRDALQDIIAIAPDELYENIIKLLTKEGCFSEAPTWSYLSYSRKIAAREVVKRRKLEGHEDGLDMPLMWEQIKKQDSPDHDIPHFHFASFRDFWEAETFLRGIQNVPLILLPGATVYWLSYDELLAEVSRFSPTERGMSSEDLIKKWAIENASKSEHQTRALRTLMHRVAKNVLRSKGLLRGPCPRCERPEWFVRDRTPKSPGRPPLTYTFCPSCAELVKKERDTERKRQKRAEKIKPDTSA